MSISATRNLCDELTAAIRTKNVERLAELVRQGADMNMTLSEGLLPVVLAANNRDAELCHVLVRLGAHLDNATDSAPYDIPLSIAIRLGLENAVATLLEIGADVNIALNPRCERLSSPDPFRLNPGSTVLQSAVYRRNLSIVRRLVEAGADVNRRDKSGNSTLHLACLDRSGDDEIVQYLLSINRGSRAACRRTDIDARNSLSQTPLMFAASVSPSTTRLLLKANPPPILDTVDMHRETALHYSVRSGREETMLMLLKAGCPVDGIGPDAAHRSTPLHVAARLGNSVFCNILLDYGADAMAISSDGDTVIHQAASCTCWTESVDILQRLVDVGVNVEKKNLMLQTAFVVAASCGNIAVARYLISIGAKMNEVASDNQTALSQSFTKGHSKMTQMLIVEGAEDPNLKNLRVKKIPHCVPGLVHLLFLTNPKFAQHQFHAYMRSLDIDVDVGSSQLTDLRHFVVAGIIAAPRSLKDNCRLVIRASVARHCNGTGIVDSLLQLPLPRSLHGFVCYVDEMPELFSRDEDSSDEERVHA